VEPAAIHGAGGDSEAAPFRSQAAIGGDPYAVENDLSGRSGVPVDLDLSRSEGQSRVVLFDHEGRQSVRTGLCRGCDHDVDVGRARTRYEVLTPLIT